MKHHLFGACASAFLLMSGAAQAAIIGGSVTSGSGSFVELTNLTGLSVGNDTFQDTNLYAFNEDQNIIIPSTITVNIGTNPQAGDVVASHYVFFDPKNTASQTGYVDFDAEILGVATATATLAASDFLLNNTVTYLNPNLRGLEAGDSVWIDSTFNYRLNVDWRASTPGDYVRVFTKQSPAGPPPTPPVPLPASSLLLLGALGAFGALRRKRG